MPVTAPGQTHHHSVSRFRHCVLLAALSVAVVAQARGAPAPRTLEEARALYRAGRYAEACPRFEEVTRAQPDNGAAWADLGLCELRRGQREASIRASLRAVREGDENVRVSAYRNLSTAGHRVAVPTGTDSCLDVEAPAEFACPRRARFCAHPISDEGNGGGKVYLGVWLTDTDNPEPPPKGLDDTRSDGVAVFLSASLWVSTKACDFSWSLSPPVFQRVLARCQASSGDEADCERRARMALAEAVSPGTPREDGAQPFPITASEQQEARAASRRCLRKLDEEMKQGSGSYCHLVAVDPCQRRVGVACDTREQWRLDWWFRDAQPKPPRERLRVEEHRWEPSMQDTP